MTDTYTQAPPPEQEPDEPPRLRALRRMVMGLMAVLMIGMVAIVAVMVLRLMGTSPAGPALPPALTLPEGETATAVTMGTGWIAVVTRAPDGTETIRLFTADGVPSASLPIPR